jgi:hypothetical protein
LIVMSHRSVDQRTAYNPTMAADTETYKASQTRVSFFETKNMAKTYNSGDSPVVTHLITGPPVKGLTYEDRTGFCALLSLWSYVEESRFWSNLSVLKPPSERNPE